MAESIWKVKAWGNAPEGRRVQPGKTAGRARASQRGLVMAAAVLGVLLLLGVAAPPLHAEAYPDKPIRFILPIAPGGGVDTIGRIVAQKLSDELGQAVVPDNRPGAGGTIGTAMAVNAKPDGYTLVIGSASITITPSLYKNLSFDVTRDLAPVSMAAVGNQVLLIHPSLPVKNVKELIAYAKANPGKLNFSSGGVGNPAHLALELFKSLTHIDIVHVPYKGAGPAMVGLLNGEVSMMTSSIPAALSHIQAGKVKVLALLGDKRSTLLGDVPTAKEAGVDNWVVPSIYGFLAPMGTPRAIIDRLNAAWAKSEAMPETREKLLKLGVEPLTSTPEQYAEFLKMEITRWRKVTAAAKIKPKE